MANKKGGGGKLSRSKIIQARLDPKLLLAAELLARTQRRTLSSLIETLIESAVENTTILATVSESSHIDDVLSDRKKREEYSIKDLTHLIWSSDEADRFAMLAFLLPDLLTAEEENLWVLIKSVSYFWAYFPIPVVDKSGHVVEHDTWPLINQKGLIKENLREIWPFLKDICEGNKSIGELEKLKLPQGKLIKKSNDDLHDIKMIILQNH